jgi:hypothetical protein
MRPDGLFEVRSGEREAPMRNPAQEDVDRLMRSAESALTGEPAHPEMTGEPILIVPGVMSHVRLPKLIPDGCRPNLTAMIMRAVEQDRV